MRALSPALRYFWQDADDQFRLFTVYGKDEAEDLMPEQRRVLKQRLELEIGISKPNAQAAILLSLIAAL